MQNVITTLYNFVCRESQFNIAFWHLRARDVGGLQAQIFQREPTQAALYLPQGKMHLTGKPGDM